MGFSDVVDGIEGALEARLRQESGVDPDLKAVARTLLRARARRTELLGVELFRDPAWDVLLDLYANGREDGMMISALCHAAGVPPTTALRYVHKLVEAGTLVSEDHPQDQRRTMVRLAPHMPERMEQVLGILRHGA
jgi:DNA-binding MarR family transcriptional regulator